MTELSAHWQQEEKMFQNHVERTVWGVRVEGRGSVNLVEEEDQTNIIIICLCCRCACFCCCFIFVIGPCLSSSAR
jgi:hypothetical protein